MQTASSRSVSKVSAKCLKVGNKMSKVILIVIFCVIIYGNTSGYQSNPVQEVYKWKKVTFEGLPKSENSYVGPYRYYDPENCDVSSMAYHPASGLMIVNVIRVRPGIPSSLTGFCVQDYPPGSSPKLWGFPNYEVNALRASDFHDGRNYDNIESRTHKHKRKPYKPHHGSNYHYGYHGGHNYYGSHHYTYQKPYYPPIQTTSTTTTTTTENPVDQYRIISSYAATVDEKCNRAFVIDVGVLNYYGNDTRVIQRPAILEFSLSSDCCETRNFPLVRKSVMPDKVSSLIPFGIFFPTLDHQSDDCDDLFIYISNAFGSYIIVYDYKNDDYWSFTDHSTFLPVVAESHFVFDQTFNFDLPLGIVSFALGYQDEYGDRTAYFILGASTAQFAVSTEVLKDKRKSPTNYNPDDFSIMGYRGCDSEAINTAVDYTYGVVFYLDIVSHSVRCWNMNKPLNPDNVGVVYESEDKLLYGVEIFVDSRGYLWFNSCHIPIIFFSDQPLDLQRPHSRVFRVKVSDAIRGTVCEDEDSYRLADPYNEYIE